MPDFDSSGVRLHYEVAGPPAGPPILLVHGYCSDYELNWVGSRWQETLTGAGHLVIGLDVRGHGRSEKPHDEAAYATTELADDAVRLLDHLGVQTAHYLGYSMGARIGLLLTVRRPERLGRVALAGIGRNGGTRAGRSTAEKIARRMRGDASITDPGVEFFYRFAVSRPINDLEALACCILGPQPPISDEELRAIPRPVAVIAGDQDQLARDAPALAEAIPGATYHAIPGRNHMNAVPARVFKEAVLAFLGDR
ncbi:MAG: alpha/beta fold hydrolase [bacterium]|jgi:pimeloyl-ACP methyl ester carboxylesterase|nr:alpha/beta fold hydrolase [bacterium]